jgi:cytoskeletal protein CcmA (bactofilin family)
MFKENTPVSSNNETETIIGPSVKVEGDFVTEGNMIIQGTVCGTIKTSKNLRVGQNSKIFANVSADNALISGEVQGNVKVKGKLELTATAKIYGDIKVETLIIAAGSVLNGKCQMGSVKEKSSKPDSSKQEKIELNTKNIEEGKQLEKKKAKK